MPKLIKLSDATLDWPTDFPSSVQNETKNNETENAAAAAAAAAASTSATTVLCAGQGFVNFQRVIDAGDDVNTVLLLGPHTSKKKDSALKSGKKDTEDDDEEEEDLPPAVDLFALSEEELQEVDYYQVLHLPYRPNLTPDDVKKAYRKACLKYHPDKSGRGEEDAVFLKVKSAFETLSTQKQAYDSTEMPFDDALPDENPADFFKEYGPVFHRNLHFDARLLPTKANQRKNNNKNRRNKKSRNGQRNNSKNPPSLGNPSTPIAKVHEFYDYWTHFTTWRDFGIQAARELETQDQLENAESRFEKRWYQKEIDKRAKKLKQQEQARITTLVERAMAADPRLIQERKRLIEEKQERQRQKEQAILDKKRKEEEARLAEERRLEEEKERRSQEKLQREKEKKLMRKTKQAFRKLVAEALSSLGKPDYDLEDDVDYICSNLTRDQLMKLNGNLESKSTPTEVYELVKRRVANLQANKAEEDEKEDAAAAAKQAAAVASQQAAAATKQGQNGNSNKDTSKGGKKVPFTREELSALAKGIKKFPPGGANRWDQIANYINNVCRPDNPRTKEECIETYNQINKASKPPATTTTAAKTTTAKTTASATGAVASKKPVGSATSTTTKGSNNGTANANNNTKKKNSNNNVAAATNGTSSNQTTPAATAPATAATTTTTSAGAGGSDTNTDGWTDEQDKLLQAGLSKFPATMDKNERWTNIANGVPGKSKKQCVQRFKAIRDAIKNNKK